MKEYLPDSPNCIVMSRQQVRSFDAWAINEAAIPGVVLMENAGRSCAEYIIQRFKSSRETKVCIFCGTGNNGGDGYVIARHLNNAGFKTAVVICGDKTKIKGDARINLDIIEKLGVMISELDICSDNVFQQVRKFTTSCDMVVDALLGTGLKGQLSSECAQLITCLNACECPIMAVDIPSGLDCDTGLPLPVCIEAELTVTFVAVKKGFVLPEAVKATGRIFIASIGVDPKD